MHLSHGLRARSVAALLAFLALSLLFFWRLWAPNPADRMTIGPADGDFVRQFYPYRTFVAGAWGSGHIPLLNPHQYSGTPALADPQQAVLYPWRLTQVPLAVAGRTLPLWAVEAEAVAHIALAGWFTFLLLRALGAGTIGSAFAGVTFAFGGYATGYPVEQLAVLDTAVWVPAVLWAVTVALSRARSRAAPEAVPWAVAAGAAVAMLVLAGHPQTAMYGVYAGAVFWLARGWREHVPARRLLGLGLVAVVAAAGLSAAQWLPSAALSGRVARDLDESELSAGLQVSDITQMLAPARLDVQSAAGGPDGNALSGVDGDAAGNGEGLANPADPANPAKLTNPANPANPANLADSAEAAGTTEVVPRAGVPRGAGSWVPLFVGALALGAAIWGAWRSRSVRAWVAAAGVAWLVSLGGNTPLYDLVIRWLPGFTMFRHQERIAVLFSLCLAVAAGLAVSRMLAGGRWRLRSAALLIATLAGITAVGAVLATLTADSPDSRAVADALVLSTLALGAGALLLHAGAREVLTVRAVGWSLVAVAALELFSVNHGRALGPVQDVDADDPVVATLVARAREGRVSSEALLPGGPNAASVYSLYDTTGDSPMQLWRHALLVEELDEILAWRLQAVRFVVSDREFPEDAPVNELAVSGDAALYEVQLPAEPVWVPEQVVVPDSSSDQERSGVERVDAAHLLEALEHDGDIGHTVFMPPDSSAALRGVGAAESSSGEATLVALDPGHAVTDVSLPGPSVVVFSTIFDSGWRATARPADGSAGAVELDVEPAYGVLASALVPAGQWRIEWTYRPVEVEFGLALFGATLLLGALWWLYRVRWKRKAASREG